MNQIRVITVSLKDPINAVEGISALDGGRTFAFHCLFWLWGVYVSMTEQNGFFTWIFFAPGISFWGFEGSGEKRDGPGKEYQHDDQFHPLGIFRASRAASYPLCTVSGDRSHAQLAGDLPFPQYLIPLFPGPCSCLPGSRLLSSPHPFLNPIPFQLTPPR